MKKTTILILLISLLLCGCSQATPEETTTTATIPQDLSEIGNSSYYCLTEEDYEPTGSDITQAIFTHKIYNPNYEYLVTLTVTINGSCSSEDETPTLNFIEGQFSDHATDGLSISRHLAGDTATIVVYLNQISVCHFQYRLYENGSIKFL